MKVGNGYSYDIYDAPRRGTPTYNMLEAKRWASACSLLIHKI